MKVPSQSWLIAAALTLFIGASAVTVHAEEGAASSESGSKKKKKKDKKKKKKKGEEGKDESADKKAEEKPEEKPEEKKEEPEEPAAPEAAAIPESPTWDKANLTRPKKKKQKIKDLEWNTDPLQVEMQTIDGKQTPTVTVKGKYEKKDKNLLFGEIPVVYKDEKTGTFELQIPLTGKETTFSLQAIDPTGKVEKEKDTITFGEHDDYIKRIEGMATRSTPRTIGVGYSIIGYTETSFRGLNQTALTVKAAYGATTKRNWDWGANFYVTALPLSVDRAGFGMRYFGANARIGRNILKDSSKWKFIVSTGAHYTTTFVTSPTDRSKFGFNNLYGPQAFLLVRRPVGAKQSFSAYFKYCPLLQDFIPALGTYEIAGGGSWGFRRKNGHVVAVSLDVASLNLNIEDTIAIKSNSTSIGLNYSW